MARDRSREFQWDAVIMTSRQIRIAFRLSRRETGGFPGTRAADVEDGPPQLNSMKADKKLARNVPPAFATAQTPTSGG
jgi:hypothetical protein